VSGKSRLATQTHAVGPRIWRGLAMSDAAPPILRITWPAVLSIAAAEVFALSLVAFGIWYLVFSETAPQDVEKEIRKNLALQVECWNRGDLDCFMELYWNDEKLTFISDGTVTTGWK